MRAVWLARHLRDTYRHTAGALAQGRIGEEHAAIIVAAAECVPEGITADELAVCEEALVAKAERMKPSSLRRAARRLLDPISRRLADQHQETQLQEQERRAERETWLWLGSKGDGTWTGKFTIPELQAHTLLARLEALSAPRRQNRNRLGQPAQDATLPGTGTLYNRYEALGLAFLELIEHLPVDGQTRSTYSLVVHVSEKQLREGAGAAVLETGAELSIGETRRLACGAGILPLVLSGASVPLDLGREQRLFTRGQAIALSSRHEHCAAEGRERPFALGRAPPPQTLVPRRADRSRQRCPALRVPPPSHPRRALHRSAGTRRLAPLHPPMAKSTTPAGAGRVEPARRTGPAGSRVAATAPDPRGQPGLVPGEELVESATVTSRDLGDELAVGASVPADCRASRFHRAARSMSSRIHDAAAPSPGRATEGLPGLRH